MSYVRKGKRLTWRKWVEKRWTLDKGQAKERERREKGGGNELRKGGKKD